MTLSAKIYLPGEIEGLKSRIEQLPELLGITPEQLMEQAGLDPGIFPGESVDDFFAAWQGLYFDNLIKRHPRVSSLWLLLGEGAPLREPIPPDWHQR